MINAVNWVFFVLYTEACAAEVFDFSKTIGILIEKKGVHGYCKNLKPIEGLTECRGQCNSSTHFDYSTLSIIIRVIITNSIENNYFFKLILATWDQVIDCTCCQPVDYRKITVELTCEDGKEFKKILTVPAVCSCENCSSNTENPVETFKPYYSVKSYMRNAAKSPKT